MVVPAVAFDLDVLAHHGETERLRRFYIEGKRFVGGRRHKAVGPVALIENTPEEDGRMVDAQA